MDRLVVLAAHKTQGRPDRRFYLRDTFLPNNTRKTWLTTLVKPTGTVEKDPSISLRCQRVTKTMSVLTP